jgi:hypothetical protein
MRARNYSLRSTLEKNPTIMIPTIMIPTILNPTIRGLSPTRKLSRNGFLASWLATSTHQNSRDSLLGEALIVVNDGCCASRVALVSFDGRLEAADTLSDPFAELRKFPGPEHE